MKLHDKHFIERELQVRLWFTKHRKDWQVDLWDGKDGGDHHAIGQTPHDALRELANYLEAKEIKL